MHRWTLRTGAAAVVLGFAFVTSATAMANDSDVIKRGNCSRGTDWKLKAKPDDGRLEVEGEVDSNKRGQVWRWKFVHDGKVAAHGRATTKGRSGSFSVERRVVNTRGADRITWRSVNARSGEVCQGGLTI